MSGTWIRHTYVFVRTDIPLADQAVQAGHACLEAGAHFPQPPEASHLVLLAVSSRDALCDALSRLDAEGIKYALFFEPDDGFGYTAACTEPLIDSKRHLFSRYRLWT